MSKKSATVSALEELHCNTANYLSNRLKDATVDMDDPEDFRVPLATGEVANIIAFLKHNNISAAPDAIEISELAGEFAGDIEAQRIAKENDLFSKSPEELERQGWLH